MKCTIPEISWHNKDPVLSIDIQPTINDGFYRLASGGTDSHVLIWHLKILETGATHIDAVTDLTRHQRAVNVVRWSPSGQYLASGDDDANIIIWHQKSDDFAVMLDGDNDDKEKWNVFKVLRGHKEDVYDICWSPDSTKLISGSVDNTAIIWDLTKGLNDNILTDHKGFVQGVTWDPLGQYIATLSSDRVCRVFTETGKQVKARLYKGMVSVPEEHYLHGQIVRYFHDDTLKSFFRRLTFSPDGRLLIAPAGCLEINNKKLYTTYIYTSCSLTQPAAIIPSPTQYSVAARCCPILFALRPEGPTPAISLPYRIIFAIATRSSVVLYDTQQLSPFATISNIHYTRLTDVTWSKDGRLLAVSSTDGFCSLVTFEDEELGVEYKEPEGVEEEMNETVEEVTEASVEEKKEKKPSFLEKWTKTGIKRKSEDSDEESGVKKKKEDKPISVIQVRRKPRETAEEENKEKGAENFKKVSTSVMKIEVRRKPKDVPENEENNVKGKDAENLKKASTSVGKPTMIAVKRKAKDTPENEENNEKRKVKENEEHNEKRKDVETLENEEHNEKTKDVETLENEKYNEKRKDAKQLENVESKENDMQILENKETVKKTVTSIDKSASKISMIAVKRKPKDVPENVDNKKDKITKIEIRRTPRKSSKTSTENESKKETSIAEKSAKVETTEEETVEIEEKTVEIKEKTIEIKEKTVEIKEKTVTIVEKLIEIEVKSNEKEENQVSKIEVRKTPRKSGKLTTENELKKETIVDESAKIETTEEETVDTENKSNKKTIENQKSYTIDNKTVEKEDANKKTIDDRKSYANENKTVEKDNSNKKTTDNQKSCANENKPIEKEKSNKKTIDDQKSCAIEKKTVENDNTNKKTIDDRKSCTNEKKTVEKEDTNKKTIDDQKSSTNENKSVENNKNTNEKTDTNLKKIEDQKYCANEDKPVTNLEKKVTENVLKPQNDNTGTPKKQKLTPTPESKKKRPGVKKTPSSVRKKTLNGQMNITQFLKTGPKMVTPQSKPKDTTKNCFVVLEDYSKTGKTYGEQSNEVIMTDDDSNSNMPVSVAQVLNFDEDSQNLKLFLEDTMDEQLNDTKTEEKQENNSEKTNGINNKEDIIESDGDKNCDTKSISICSTLSNVLSLPKDAPAKKRVPLITLASPKHKKKPL